MSSDHFPTIAIIGEFDPQYVPHAATNAALEHTRDALELDFDWEWLSTADIDVPSLSRYAGIWVAPGSPYKNMKSALDAIRYARENEVPCFGTCGGCQHIVVEYARNVLGYKDAQHAEYDPYASTLFISRLECSLVGREMTLKFKPGSKLAGIYGALEATERYYCNFGVNPEVVELLNRGRLRVVASDPEGEVRALELPGHPFFVATLFVPQTLSQRGHPHPVVADFVRAVAERGVVRA